LRSQFAISRSGYDGSTDFTDYADFAKDVEWWVRQKLRDHAAEAGGVANVEWWAAQK